MNAESQINDNKNIFKIIIYQLLIYLGPCIRLKIMLNSNFMIDLSLNPIPVINFLLKANKLVYFSLDLSVFYSDLQNRYFSKKMMAFVWSKIMTDYLVRSLIYYLYLKYRSILLFLISRLIWENRKATDFKSLRLNF